VADVICVAPERLKSVHHAAPQNSKELWMFFGKPARAFVLLVCVSIAFAGTAQQVVVYDPAPPIEGSTPQDHVTPDDTNQRIIFIPVVTQDTAWDPNNNTLPAATMTSLTAKAAEVSDFWNENSYGRVSFQAEVAPRVYQMPRGKDFYFNPAYLEPRLTGSGIAGPSITVPAGNLRLVLHVSDADETTINIPFTAAESPFTFDALKTKICDNLGVGDKIACTFQSAGPDRQRINLAVDESYAVAGTYVHVDVAGSNADLLDVLGLDETILDLAEPDISVETRGAEFPVTAANANVTLTLLNEAGVSTAFVWSIAAQTFNTAADFASVVGSANPDATITAVGDQLRFALTPSIPGPYQSLIVSGPDELLDELGLATAQVTDRVIDKPSSRTVRGDRRGIAGQAIAAMVLNELTRPHTDPGADPWPNMDITAANEAAIDALVQSKIDPNRTFIVVFLDPPLNQRAGAGGGFIDAGIENGGYTYHYQLHGGVQIIYDTTDVETIAHEVGHNIGFADLYNNSTDYLAGYQYANNWDVMHAQGLFPHTAFWHKELVARWLTNGGAAHDSFPEPAAGASTRQYVLTPLELSAAQYDDSLGGVPAGRTKVKAIRLPLGIGPAGDHHFLVVQNRQPGQTFSQQLPQKLGAAAPGGVYIEDAISWSNWTSNLFNATTRNVVHPITDRPPLASGDVNPILDNAPNADIDLLSSFPAYDGTTVNIVGEIAGPGGFAARPSYLVDVTREQKNFLDLAITPWGAPPYESPDIWIEHADGSLSTTPLPGNGEATRWSATYDPAANGGNPLNWIRVRVSNAGTVDATAVKVRVKLNQPGGMGDTGTWVSLPTSAGQDIPAGQSRIFNLPWTPKVNEHTCVQAEVIDWTSVLGDRDPWNQRTQENVNDFHPTSSSPWTPVPMQFDIANRRSVPIHVAVAANDVPPGYVVAFEQSFLTIPAKTKVRVNATLMLDETIIPTALSTQRRPKPGMFHVTAALMNDEYQLPMGGITYRVFPDKKINATVTVSVDANGNIVVDGTTSPAAPGDEIEILVCYPSGKCEWVKTTTDSSGNIHVVIPPKEPGSVSVGVYLPPNYGPGRLDETVVDTTKPGSGSPGGSGGSGGAHEFGLFAGGFFPSNKTSLESGLDTGFRYGRFIHPQWSIEGELGIVFTRRLGQRGLLGRAQAHALWHAGNALQPVRPFLLVGAGFASFHTPANVDSAPLLAIGAGADFRWRPDVGFRVDARDLVMFDLVSSGTTHNIEVLWGVTFWF
jgi:hypothetical protein